MIIACICGGLCLICICYYLIAYCLNKRDEAEIKKRRKRNWVHPDEQTEDRVGDSKEPVVI